MTQNTKLKQMPTKSGEWLEAECLKLARRTLGGSEIQYVTIRRLHPKGTRPNWKVADLIPQPTPLVSREVRDALAHLTGTYASGACLLARIPLGLHPSLHRLRCGRDRFVRRLPSYYGRV